MNPNPQQDLVKNPRERLQEALDGLLSGALTTDDVIRIIEELKGSELDDAAAIRKIVDSVHSAGLLNDDTYDELKAGIRSSFSEQLPTFWSEDIAANFVDSLGNGADAGSSGNPHEINTGEHVALQPQDFQLVPGAVLRHRYVLTARLDAGGMGQVFKALDLQRKEANADVPWIAVKLIKGPFDEDSALLNALHREAVNGKELIHPNIAHVYDFDHEGDYFFITMEWLQGQPLSQVLDDMGSKKMPPERVRKIVEALGHALQFAHEKEIIHADVKPDNVFVTTDGEIKLFDFGLARAARGREVNEDNAGVFGCTPQYASCEVIEGARPTVQDDLFSLACIAYRMIAGRRPFGRSTAFEAEATAHKIRRPGGLDDRQWSALVNALAFRRNQRTPNVRAFMNEFLHTGVPAPGATRIPAAQRSVALTLRGRPVPWMAAAPGAFIVAAVLAAVLWPVGGDDPPPTVKTPLVAAPAATPVPPPVAPAPATSTMVQEDAGPVPPPAEVGPPAELLIAAEIAEPLSEPEPVPEPEPASEPDSVAAAEPPAPVARPQPVAIPMPLRVARLAEPPEPEPVPEAVPVAAPGPVLEEAPQTPQLRSVPLSALDFRRFVEPVYPRRLRRDGVAGWVVVDFAVTEEGRTTDIGVVEAEPAEVFEEAALDAVRQWRFRPPVVDGEASGVRSVVRLRFAID